MLWRALWLPGTFLDTGGRPPVWAAVLGGAGIGLGWGAVARVFMRLISDDPEFTVPGTAFILAAFTVAGAFAGLAFAARRRGWRQRRVHLLRTLALVAVIPLSAGAGSVLLISLMATLGVTRNGWPRIARGVLLAVSLVLLLGRGDRFMEHTDLPALREAVVFPFLAWLVYGEFLALRVGLEPAAANAPIEAEAGSPPDAPPAGLGLGVRPR